MGETLTSDFEPVIESEPITESGVALYFMRHGKKEKWDISDEEIPLTVAGRIDAWRKGNQMRAHPEVAIAVGSPRKRTRETSAHVMLGARVAPNASLEEMEAEIAKELKYGKKITTDPRLNLGGDGPVNKEADEAYEQKRIFAYLAEESDQRAIELSDKESATLSRYAGNVAEIIYDKQKMAGNFHKLVETDREKYKHYNNRLERYLGTHAGVQESFIVKVLEKVGEDSKRQAFMEAYPNGFKELQGMNIEISTRGREQKIFLTYEVPDKSGKQKTERIELTGDILEQLIEERRQFEQAVAESG